MRPTPLTMQAVRQGATTCVALLVFLVAVSPGHAQDVGAAPQQEEEAPLPSDAQESVRVDLVQIPITALDRQGRAITDLRAEEIVVKDRGKRLRVAYLDRLAASEAASREPADVELFVRAPGGTRTPVTAAAGGASYLVLLVDVENDPVLQRDDMVDALIAFARERVASGTRVAVASFDGELRLESPFTMDADAVARAVRQARGRTPKASLDLRARIRGLLDRVEDCKIAGSEFQTPVADGRCLRDVANEYTEEFRPQAMRFLDGLDALLTFLEGLDGRKNVLAVSHGVPVESTPVVIEAMRAVFGSSEQVMDVQSFLGFGEQPRVRLDRLLERAVRARISVSFVDRMSVPTGDFGAMRGHALQPGTQPMRAAFEAARADMEEAAVTTGGIHVHSPDITAGLQRVRQSQEGSYELGYYVDEYLPPKRLAKVEIDTTRKGVRLVHRRGYYAPRADQAQTLPGTITVAAPARRSKAAEGARYVFQLQVDPKDIGYRIQGDEAAANFTLHVVVEDAEGRPLADSYHFINHAYPKTTWEAGETGPVLIGGWVELPPGEFTLVATLRNTETDRRGRISRRLAVPSTVPDRRG